MPHKAIGRGFKEIGKGIGKGAKKIGSRLKENYQEARSRREYKEPMFSLRSSFRTSSNGAHPDKPDTSQKRKSRMSFGSRMKRGIKNLPREEGY